MNSLSKKQQTKKKQLKDKLCRYQECRKPFTPWNGFVKCCSPYCAEQDAKIQIEKKKQQEKRAALKEFNQGDKSYMFQLAKQAMQKYARMRDYGLDCISCGKPYHKGQVHGGHLRPAGNYKQVCFNLWNINAQCAQCNAGHMGSGKVTEYEIGLIKKIGKEKVEWLKCQTGTKTYEIDYLKRLVKVFGKKILMVKKRKGIK